jgi:hypothetical protein
LGVQSRLASNHVSCFFTLTMRELKRNSMRTLFVILLLIGSAVAGAAAYHGVFYVTGSQFYEGCWERGAKEKEIGGFKDAQAGNPGQAVIWASCFPIVAEVMDKAGFALGSSRPDAPANAKALAGPCPDRQTEIPLLIDRIWIVVIDAIEKSGGPSLIDRVAPASWVIERALKARWPHCIDAARPYIAAAKNSSSPK